MLNFDSEERAIKHLKQIRCVMATLWFLGMAFIGTFKNETVAGFTGLVLTGLTIYLYYTEKEKVMNQLKSNRKTEQIATNPTTTASVADPKSFMSNKKIIILAVIISLVISAYKVASKYMSTANEKAKLVSTGMSIDEVESILGRHDDSRWYQISGSDHLWWRYPDGSRLYLEFRKVPYKPFHPGRLEKITTE
ncbi:MAG: hypothetical protein AB1805_00015 [Nitrospirota bacterium]